MPVKEDVKFTQDTKIVQTIIDKAMSQHTAEKSLNINVFNLQVSNYEAAEPPLQIETEPEPLKIEQEKEKDITLNEFIQLLIRKRCTLAEFQKKTKKLYVMEVMKQSVTISEAAKKLNVTRSHASKLRKEMDINVELA